MLVYFKAIHYSLYPCVYNFDHTFSVISLLLSIQCINIFKQIIKQMITHAGRLNVREHIGHLASHSSLDLCLYLRCCFSEVGREQI